VLEKYDVRVISDEVICGFGRLGHWFGADALDFKPTSISMAKAITGAYFPMGAITIEEDLYQAMLSQSEKIGVFGHGYTYTAHPVGCAVALKVIEIYERENMNDHVRKVSKVFGERFAKLADHPLVGEVRCMGMIGAAELVADKRTRRNFDAKKLVGPTAARLMEKHGLITRAGRRRGGPVPAARSRITEAWVRSDDLRARSTRPSSTVRPLREGPRR
jgi:4-aminobutyrate---pyruvate transaminase